MAEKKHDIDQLTEKRIINIIEKEIASYEGISSLSTGGLTTSIADTVLRRDPILHGIRLDKVDDSYSISIKVNVYYGVNIPQLSYDIQTSIKNALSDEDILLKSINISVEGIDKTGVPNE